MDPSPSPFYVVAFATVTTLVLLVMMELAQRIVVPSKSASDAKNDNAARRLLRVGQVIAVFLVAAAAVKNSVTGESLAHDVMWVAAFGVGGLALVEVTGHIGIRLLLKARLAKEIERGNVAAGIAGGANFVATGIVTSHALAGNDLASLGLSLAFFLLAQVTLHVFVSLFRALTTYDDAEQIHGENMAASISYAGALIAIAIIVARAVQGDFAGWALSLRGYGGVLLAAIALYPVRQIFVQSLLLRAPFTLRGGRLDRGIAAERNAAMGTLEAAAYIATALSIAHLA
jgi:uncharacterized membrane protein YjfL (UPF0719 family)